MINMVINQILAILTDQVLKRTYCVTSWEIFSGGTQWVVLSEQDGIILPARVAN